jgi:hypothetical protein
MADPRESAASGRPASAGTVLDPPHVSKKQRGDESRGGQGLPAAAAATAPAAPATGPRSRVWFEDGSLLTLIDGVVWTLYPPSDTCTPEAVLAEVQKDAVGAELVRWYGLQADDMTLKEVIKESKDDRDIHMKIRRPDGRLLWHAGLE